MICLWFVPSWLNEVRRLRLSLAYSSNWVYRQIASAFFPEKQKEKLLIVNMRNALCDITGRVMFALSANKALKLRNAKVGKQNETKFSVAAFVAYYF